MWFSTQGDTLLFSLNAVLVHSGYTANSGHYYCYVKSSTGIWFCMNDANVSNNKLLYFILNHLMTFLKNTVAGDDTIL